MNTVTITANESGTRTAHVELHEAASHVAARGSYNHVAQLLIAFADSETAPKTITDDDGDIWELVSHIGDDYTYALA